MFKLADTNSIAGGTTENKSIDGRSKEEVHAFEVDISDGIAVEMFGLASSTEEVLKTGLAYLTRKVILQKFFHYRL